MIKLLLTSMLLISLVVRAHAGDARPKHYVNKRFGFSLSYPATLIASREPEDGAGLEFHSADKHFSLEAFGGFLNDGSDEDSLERRWQAELKSLGGTVRYKVKTSTWYVISGVARDGTEYYSKCCSKAGNYATFRITYPHNEHTKYDPWVVQIEKSFVPFLNGDFDRIQTMNGHHPKYAAFS